MPAILPLRAVRWGIFAIVLIAGLWIRCDFVRATAARTEEALDFDARYYYVSAAEALLAGRGFDWSYHHRPGGPPYAVVGPLQSLFLAAVFWLRGDYDLFAPMYVQAYLCMLAGCLLFDLMRRWRGWSAALAAWTFFALYPDFIVWTRTPLTENNYLLFFAGSLWLTAHWARRPSAPRAALAAALFGLTNLQRAVGLLLSYYLAALALFELRGPRKWLQAALFIFVPYAIMSPWLVRNLVFNGDAVWTACNGGLLLQMVNNVNYDARTMPDLANVKAEVWKVPELEARFWSDEFAPPKRTWFRYSKLYMPVFENYVLHHPLHFARNYAIRFWNQFTILPTSFKIVYPRLPSAAARLWFLAVLMLGLAGLVFPLRVWRDPTHRSLAMTFFYFASFGALMPWLGSGRYALSLRVLLVLFAAGLITSKRRAPSVT